jgi:imidazolonepropionase-like amidohydrolase
MTGKTLIRAARLIDGSSSDAQTGLDVLVEGGRIRTVAPTGTVDVGDDIAVVDLGDRTLLPGLIDLHVHFTRTLSEEEVQRTMERPELRLIRSAVDAGDVLRAGFTTVRHVGGMDGIFVRDAVNEGTIPGPRIQAAGLPVSQTGGHGDMHFLPLEWVAHDRIRSGILADGADECRRAVRMNLREGADLIKVMASGGVATRRDHPRHAQFTHEELKAVVDEAARWDRRVAAHAGGAGIKPAVEAGVSTIEHGYFLTRDVAELMAEKGTFFVPTLLRLHRGVTRGPEVGASPWINEKFAETWEAALTGVAMAKEVGVRIALGTDLGLRPHTRHGWNWQEIPLLVDAGLSPMEAIQAGTSVAAAAMGLEDTIGRIADEYEADMIAVDGDPLSDPQAVGRVEWVMKSGTVERAL